ncbi:ABC transporter permease [Poritiphilus flavus]|uniref:FtsX-like permease family protein n=1 Tax=Poritiphilus flavus TaxID=2697053 RepID=A0A6L9EAJ9_9FLAO|nr:ABC transporter permease [Poritiphilus flavus]NAS11612.1 FtsX-like permease family protein [Poritiphilus flavus]
MFKNQLKIAWRNLTKNRLQTIINLLGLTVGTVSCLVILLYVFDQMGYDEHHVEAESIYRVKTFIDGASLGTEDINSANSSPPIAFALKEDFPEIEEACRVVLVDNFNVDLISSTESEDSFFESRAYLADSTFFKIFNYKFIAGDPKTALNEPSTLVLSSALAKKMFGNENAVGKSVEISGYSGDPTPLVVTGVYDETFGKSHLKPNYVISMNNPGLGAFVRSYNNFAYNNFVRAYVKLVPGTNAAALQQKFPEFLRSRGGSDLDAVNMKKELSLQPVKDIHLYSKGIEGQLDRVSDIQYLYLLLTLAFFIQLVACINFVNLSTARANKRAKEIGVRKVVGADKGSLVFQFLGESLLLSVFSVLISLPIVLLLLPYINDLAQSNLAYPDLFNGNIVFSLLALGTLTGLLAGIYPALVLSSIKPIVVLKSVINLKSGSGNLRRALVVFQFIISIGLITTVIIVFQQFNYTQRKNLGFQKDDLISVQLNTQQGRTSFEALKTQVREIPGVSQIAGTWFSPSEQVVNDMGLYLPGKNPENRTLVKINWVGDNYLETMGIPLLQGRTLKEIDSNQVIVNQATLKAFNISEEKALSSRLLYTDNEETSEFEIVGVTGDYHFASLKEPIEPIMLFSLNEPRRMVVRMNAADYGSIVGQLESIWESTVTSSPFVHSFVDRDVEQMYEEEKRIGEIAVLFTILAILISCLGLFGLISYIAEQKKKEIGIRKVLGASIDAVVRMLTTDFVKLILIAFVIASPLVYFLMQSWLQDFAYKIEISWWVFVLAGSITLLIALLTVGFQSIKSAMVNPAKSLRTE